MSVDGESRAVISRDHWAVDVCSVLVGTLFWRVADVAQACVWRAARR
jgi:hypothetical protein